MGNRAYRVPCLAVLLWVVLVPGLAAAQPGYDHGLLWRIQGPGSEPDYVFGTIHIEDPRVLALPDAVVSALATADTFVMELKPDLSSLTQLGTAMLYSDGSDLEQILGKELFARAAKVLAARGISEPAARNMKPWAVLITLSVPEPETGMVLDIVLYTKAVQQGKRIQGLESAEEQVSVLADLPLSMQIDLIRESLDNQALMDEVHQRLVEAYLARDLDAMQTLNDQAMAMTDAGTRDLVTTRMVTDRNRRMVQRMRPALQEGTAFVAVGALHLPGPEGILRLLEQRGYTVTKVY